MQSPLGAQRTSEGVQYFKHFLKSFLRLYRKADSDLHPENAFARLHNWNCEWLNRPDVAMSEFTDTILNNVAVIRDNCDILRNTFVHDVEASFNPILPSLQKFNKQAGPQDIAPTRQDVANVMRVLEGTTTSEQTFQKLFHVGGAMYLLGVHSLIPSFLLWNPEEYSGRVKETKETALFRTQKDAKAMRDYLLGCILRKPAMAARTAGSGPRPSSFWEEELRMPPPSTSTTRDTASIWEKRDSNDDTDAKDNEGAEENSHHEEYHVQTREEFQETSPLDRGKRPASTSTETTTTGKKKRATPSTSRGRASTSRGQKSTRGRGCERRGRHIFFSED